MAIRENRVGMMVGLLLGGWHFVWSVLVALQLAQPVVDFVFWIHFLKPVIIVEAFSLDRAALLVGLTAVIGYVVGWLAGFLWNRMVRAA